MESNLIFVPKGLYHYSVKQNELEQLLEEDLAQHEREIFGEEIVKDNPNFIVLTGVMSRSEVKYGVNAYRFALLECGHIGQNVTLLAAERNLACCPLGGFDNDKLIRLLDLTEDEIPLYAFSLGQKLPKITASNA